MSTIPDIRNPITKPLYSNTIGAKELAKNPENGYFQGYLNDNDASCLFGYDWAIDEVFENFFFNLDVYADDLDECGFDDVRMKKFDEIFAEFLAAEQTDSPMELDKIGDSKIALVLTLFRAFRDWAEMSRDEIGTSMIEGMSEEEYQECVEKYKAGYKNALLRKEN